MTIQEFATLTGLTVHTLRYYEQIGLLDQIQRAPSGHLIYQQQDLLWVAFIKKLKATGMPLREIQLYADLRKQGITPTRVAPSCSPTSWSSSIRTGKANF